MLKRLRKWIRKYKFKAKKFIYITLLSIVEILLLLWGNDWQYTHAIFAVLIQYVLIFEKKVDELKEGDLKSFLKGVMKLLKDGKTSDEILEEIKKED